ncbi:MAG: glycogen debranching protein GlgX [Microcoleaceae cyanobacterium]
MSLEVLAGKSFPLGATVHSNGVNFCVFSKTCSALELLLFDTPEAVAPTHVIPFAPEINKTFYYWHMFVPEIQAGQIYAYRADGIHLPEAGYRFDPEKVLLDPYAKAIVNDENYSRAAASQPGDNCAQALKSVVVDPRAYDWEGDLPLRISYADTVIYELHVGGFTRDPSSGLSPQKRGTYAGLIEKIPYLKELGVTAVELMPVHQFDEQDAVPPRKNYWGYSTIAFFAPHRRFSSRRDPLGPVHEFRDMVKAFHRAGIEVILDVVFNHTAEGNHNGPTLSFRGLDNFMYYILEDEPEYYGNYSGCGNTVKANQEITGQLIVDCLRYWVSEMHVDGFRFDLASIFSRDKNGYPMDDPPILWIIESDPVLAGTKLIAEAWDAGGLYQVGSFARERFTEWNGQYRDDIRSFVKSDPGKVVQVANRIMGSPDIYPLPRPEAHCSINFITCHDGFTLNDLVSYNQKHNEANGENNRDGSDHNISWNCGREGLDASSSVEALRLKQLKNFWTILFISQGIPMILMGDEVRRTQNGNNNAYCQDNELSWFDWSAISKQADVFRFLQGLIRFTQKHQIFRLHGSLETGPSDSNPNIVWHGTKLDQPNWEPDCRYLAFSLHHPEANEYLYVILNAYWELLTFEIPRLPRGKIWVRIADTALPAPNDFSDLKTARAFFGMTYRVNPRSSVILMARSLT